MDLPRYHRLRGAYYRLEGPALPRLRRIVSSRRVRPAPPAARPTSSRTASAGRGTVYSFTEMVQAPAGFSPPFLMALVQLEEGPMLAAQLTDVDPEAIAIGMPVEMVTRRLQEQGPRGYLVYGYKFRPPLQPASAAS